MTKKDNFEMKKDGEKRRYKTKDFLSRKRDDFETNIETKKHFGTKTRKKRMKKGEFRMKKYEQIKVK